MSPQAGRDDPALVRPRRPRNAAGYARRPEPLSRRLAAIARLIETRLPAQVPDLEGLASALAALEKQVARAGREQFKASTLAEAQRDQLREALDALREAEAEREQAAAQLRERGVVAIREARLEVARSLLPALDGLEAAIRSGSQLETSDQPGPRRGWFGRATRSSEEALRANLQAWLEGLQFVRERLLAVLAAEGITPIPAQGLPFDPRIHLAAEVSPAGADAPPGTITGVIRTGYLAGEQVLRPAEVAVARAE